MTRKHTDRLAVAAAGLLAAAGGCGNTPNARFYLLAPVAVAEAEKEDLRLPGDAAVGLEFVRIPPYLDRPQIVTRVSGHELKLSEFHRWAEPLNQNVTEVVAANLRTLLGTDAVTVATRLGVLEVQYGVRIEIERFDARPGSEATLEVRWGVVAGADGKTPPVLRLSRYTKKDLSASYDALVRAESELLFNLSRDIAGAIVASSK